MKIHSAASATLLLASYARGVFSSQRTTLAKLSAPPPSFVHVGPAPDDAVVSLKINLFMGDATGLESALAAASDPQSPKFRQWLSKEEVESFARPSEDARNSVLAWLSSHGLEYSDATPAGDWIALDVPACKANEMFDTNMSIFKEVETGQHVVRSLEYGIPSSLSRHIRVVHPMNSFASTRIGSGLRTAAPSSPRVLDPPPTKRATACTDVLNVTMACIQEKYGLPTAPATAKGNSIGVSAFDNQFANQADLSLFLQAQRPDIPSNSTFSFISVDGGTNSQNPDDAGIEADLDIQLVFGLATDVPTTFISVGQKNGTDQYVEFALSLAAMDNPPLVVTTSYGHLDETDLSLPATQALCDTFTQLAARGVSVLWASGDQGVGDPSQCSGKPFVPTFPTCPSVTLVGGTLNLGSGDEVYGGTAGGFSNYFPTASYQASAVAGYLQQIGNTNAGLYNASGRGYPDVAAVGDFVHIIYQGNDMGVDGTSLSSPIFAAVIALLNDELLNAGKAPLGFLNPWLYANPSAFTDITQGHNPGCGTAGFFALPGWDPASGLGTPIYSALRTAAGLK